MKILFTEEAWKDLEWFLDNDKQLVKRIREVLKDILRNPEEGIRNPERLKPGNFQREREKSGSSICSDYRRKDQDTTEGGH